MTYKDLVDNISSKMEVKKKDAGVLLDNVIETIKEGLMEDGVVKLLGIGTLKLTQRKGRTGVIQFGESKGQEWKTEDTKTVTLSVSSELKEFINK
jgi:nucleoid DNA-binding protein